MPHFQRDEHNKLYYELDGTGTHKLIMIIGFAASLRMFDKTVQHLTQEGKDFQILRLDNRGSGKSTGPMVKQTTYMLAKDCFELIKHVGWGNEKIHVYGASLGGMIAQELALFLIHKKQLLSLYLAVTCRKRYPLQVPCPPGIWKGLFSLAGLNSMSKEKLLDLALTSGYSKGFRESVDQESGRLMDEVLREEHAEEQNELQWSVETIAAQSCAVATHNLNNQKLTMILDSKVPITCLIATEDSAMPTPLQYELAEALRATTIIFNGGHLSVRGDPVRFYQSLENFIISNPK